MHINISMIEMITKMLDSLELDYSVSDTGVHCKNIVIIPVYRNSDIDLASIANSRISKIVLEGEAERDITRIKGFLTPKIKVRGRSVKIVPSFNETIVPEFVKDIYDEKDYKSDYSTIDLNFLFRGKVILWFRFLVISKDRLFLLRVVGHPDFSLHRSTIMALEWFREHYPQYTQIRTIATTRNAHYYRIGFREIRVETLKSLSLAKKDIDGNYRSADKIEYYFLEYDYNSNLPFGRN